MMKPQTDPRATQYPKLLTHASDWSITEFAKDRARFWQYDLSSQYTVTLDIGGTVTEVRHLETGDFQRWNNKTGKWDTLIVD